MQILEPRRTRLPNPSTRCFLDSPSYVRLLLERFSVCVLTCLVPYCLGQLVHLVLCPDKCPRGPNDHWWKDDRSAQHDSQGLPSFPWQSASMFQEATRSPSLPSASIVSRLFASRSQARRHGDTLSHSTIHAHTSAKRWSSLARSGLVFLPPEIRLTLECASSHLQRSQGTDP